MTNSPRDQKQSGSSCPTLGITGGVASGKSTVARSFEQLGASRISADEIARDLLTPGSLVTRQVIEAFGPNITQVDQAAAIDRKALAKLIYADDAARRQLGKIMHPVIRDRMRAQIEDYRASGSEVIVAEIPLLYENNLAGLVDAVLVAVCSEAAQVQRLQARQPWLSAGDALLQVRSQLPLQEKAARADYVISTETTMDDVEREVGVLYRKLKTGAAPK